MAASSDPYIRTFHPGATNTPLIQCYLEPLTGDVGDWTAEFALRRDDTETTAVLELDGTVEEVAADTLDAEITDLFPAVDPLWRVTVQPASADTQDLRGPYSFGLDLIKGTDPTLPPPDYENVPLFSGASINFTTDIAR